MQKGKFNTIVDAGHGSSAKGAVSARLVDIYKVENCSSGNYPNAGHTVVHGDLKFVAKALPTPAFLNTMKVWTPNLWLGPNSGYFKEQLDKELKETNYHEMSELLRIHERSVIVSERHLDMERPGGTQSTEYISSTMSGSGAAFSEKSMRRPEVELSRTNTLAPEQFMRGVRAELLAGRTFLHEVSQGFALSVNHGTHYPFCLNADARVVMADGSTRRMKDLVDARSTEQVLSVNKDGVICKQPITNWVKKPIGQNTWMQVILTSSRKNKDGVFYGPKFTNDHRILTTRGYLRVDELQAGDKVINGERQLDSVGLQVFLGGMLGDGCVYAPIRNSSRTKTSFSHSSAQEEYATFKASILSKSLGGKLRKITTGNGSFKPGAQHLRYESAASVYMVDLGKRYGCLGKKNINVEAIMSDIDELGLAIWYMDDGQYKRHSTGDEVYLHTQGFTEDQVGSLISALSSKFDIKATRIGGQKGKPILRIARQSHGTWFGMIAKYVTTDLRYKVPSRYMSSQINIEAEAGPAYHETVVDVITSTPSRYRTEAYCIEVSDTHNFYVSNEKGMFAVSNCTFRDCTPQQAYADFSILPSMVGDVYLNVRSFPIRVGNNYTADGKQVGYSGDFCDDQVETTWEQIARDAEMPPDEAAALAERERTTVTKKIRRVATQSWKLLRYAADSTGATKVVLNFPQYIHWSAYGVRGGMKEFRELHPKVRSYIDKMEEATNLKVVMIGTSAQHDDYIWLG